MFFTYQDPSIRYTGRFAEYDGAMTATATGSVIEIAFTGPEILLHFDIRRNEHPYPHLWLCMDGGCRTEAPLSRYLRLEAEDGPHLLTVIFKSAKEQQPRFFHPLVGKISFLGYDAQGSGTVPEDNRKTLEVVGDSITEGVLIDDHLTSEIAQTGQDNRVYQDDVTATYASLTAKNLNLKLLNMGYGAVGVTRSGCGAYPKAAEGYPYCFEGCPVSYGHPDYILINHGANDRRPENAVHYTEEYRKLLDLIHSTHPDAKIFCLSPFCGAFVPELSALIEAYNLENRTDIVFISSEGWISPDPLHPRRDGHKTVSEHLTKILKQYL